MGGRYEPERIKIRGISYVVTRAAVPHGLGQAWTYILRRRGKGERTTLYGTVRDPLDAGRMTIIGADGKIPERFYNPIVVLDDSTGQLHVVKQ